MTDQDDFDPLEGMYPEEPHEAEASAGESSPPSPEAQPAPVYAGYEATESSKDALARVVSEALALSREVQHAVVTKPVAVRDANTLTSYPPEQQAAWLVESMRHQSAHFRSWSRRMGLEIETKLIRETGVETKRALPALHQDSRGGIWRSRSTHRVLVKLTYPGDHDQQDVENVINGIVSGAEIKVVEGAVDRRDGAGRCYAVFAPALEWARAWGIEIPKPPPIPAMTQIRQQSPQVAHLIEMSHQPDPNTRWAKSLVAAKLVVKEQIQRRDGSFITRHHLPEVTDVGMGERGPWIDLCPVYMQGQTSDDIIAAKKRLRGIFNLAHLDVYEASSADPDNLSVRIAFNTKGIDWPKFVPLDPRTLVRPRTLAEVVKASEDVVIPIGFTLKGEHIRINFRRAPHAVFVGVPGAGKSRFLQSLISAMALQGVTVVIWDGKGGEDFVPLMQDAAVPNVLTLGSETATLIRLTAWVADEARRRRDATKKLKLKGVLRLMHPPMVLVADEFAQARKDIKEHRKDDFKSWWNDVDTIFRLGRSQCIGFFAVSQTLEDDAFGDRLMRLIHTRLSLGAPNKMTLEKLFSTDGAFEESRRLAAEIPPPDQAQGRGLILGPDGTPRLIQVYWAYTPAEEIQAKFPAEVRANWTDTKNALAEVPRLAPRFAWAFPPEPDLDDPWLDWPRDRLYHEIAPMDLDLEPGVPDPDLARFDPSSDEYDPGEVHEMGAHEKVKRSRNK